MRTVELEHVGFPTTLFARISFRVGNDSRRIPHLALKFEAVPLISAGKIVGDQIHRNLSICATPDKNDTADRRRLLSARSGLWQIVSTHLEGATSLKEVYTDSAENLPSHLAL